MGFRLRITQDFTLVVADITEWHFPWIPNSILEIVLQLNLLLVIDWPKKGSWNLILEISIRQYLDIWVTTNPINLESKQKQLTVKGTCNKCAGKNYKGSRRLFTVLCSVWALRIFALWPRYFKRWAITAIRRYFRVHFHIKGGCLGYEWELVKVLSTKF